MRFHRCTAIVFLALSVSLFSQSLSAQEWTRFRGENGAGVSNAKTIPVSWTQDDLNWKVKLPGSGHSSPVQFGDQIFLLSADADSGTRFVIAVNADSGKINWTKKYDAGKYRFHRLNSYNSSTPAVDKDHVYVAWSDKSSTTLRALDHQGKEVWKKELGPWVGQHGFAASPIVYKNKVIISNSQQKDQLRPGEAPGQSIVYAFDTKSGKEIWRSERVTTRVSYAVPCIYKNSEGVDELVGCSRAEGIYSLNPENGKRNWAYEPAFDKRTVSSPIVFKDTILGSCGSGGGGNFVVAVKAGQSPEMKYKIDRSANYVPTPVVSDDLIFLVSDKGVATCFDGNSGEVIWRERLNGTFWSSPVRVLDRIYAVNEAGEVIVFAAARKFKKLGTSELGEKSHSTPAIANGKMILRTVSHLMSVGGKP